MRKIANHVELDIDSRSSYCRTIFHDIFGGCFITEFLLQALVIILHKNLR